MEGLFFVIHPTWFTGSILQFNEVLFFLGIFFIAGYYLIRQKSQHSMNKKEREYSLKTIDPYDPQYIEKTIQEIRKYITITKNPKHSWAHIPKEISRYFQDGNLIRILEKLENIEYSGKELHIEELQRIQNELIKKTI